MATPPVYNEGVIITSAINANEGRDIDTVDIHGQYLHNYTNYHMINIFKGCLTKLMVMVDSKLYRKYITYYRKGGPLLYTKIIKALYGILISVILFYLNIIEDLQIYGLEFNRYDIYILNKIIYEPQMTVPWHVDDLKVSHKNLFPPSLITTYPRYTENILLLPEEKFMTIQVCIYINLGNL